MNTNIKLRPFGALNQLFSKPWSLLVQSDVAVLVTPQGQAFSYSPNDAALSFKLSNILSGASNFEVFVEGKWVAFVKPSREHCRLINNFVNRGMQTLKLSSTALRPLALSAIRDACIGIPLLFFSLYAIYAQQHERKVFLFWGAFIVGVSFIFRSINSYMRYKKLVAR